MKSLRFAGFIVLCATAFLLAVSLSPAGNGKKKKDKKDDVDIVGVITDVDRDGNPKDKDIGKISIRKDNKQVVRVTVLKGTDIMRDGKKVEFKALDKGDRVAVYTKKGMPQVAEKIVIRKE
jgi:hypothetical protein